MTIKLTLEFESLEDLRCYLDDKVPALIEPTHAGVTPLREYVSTPPPGPSEFIPIPATGMQDAAPTQTTAVVPQPASTVGMDGPELDKDGIPWDARIHAKTKTKTKDGRWKKLRKIDEVTFGNVVGELQEKMTSDAAQLAPGVVGAAAQEPAPGAIGDPAAVFGQPEAAAPQPTPAAMFGQPVDVAGPAHSWQDICDAAHAAQLQQKCDLVVFSGICEKFGYDASQHGKGQQNVALWCEHQTDQATKNAIHAELKALTT